MKILFFLLVITTISAQTVIIDDFTLSQNSKIDFNGGNIKLQSNFIDVNKYEKNKLVEIEGSFIKSLFVIDTNFTSVFIDEDGKKSTYKTHIDSIVEYDYSYQMNDTIYKNIEKIYYLNTEEDTKIMVSFANNTYFNYFYIVEYEYKLTYSYVRNKEEVISIIEHNKLVLEEKIKGD